MSKLIWSRTSENTVDRMELCLQKIDEGIRILEDAGLDMVAKKLRNAYKMAVKDINERWMPTNEMPAEDILKELQKIARKNANIEI